MKSKIALILMALACAFAAVPAHAEEEFNPTPQQVQEWRASAERGDAGAQKELGRCYYYGKEVEKDLREAVRWWRKSAEQGNAKAQCNLGVCYANGNGVEKDFREAVRWYRKAAEQGFAAAQHDLGSCYYYGIGVEKDLREAVRWYRKSAEQGNAKAQFNLGLCYKNGDGVEKDSREAVRWYRKAAEQGVAHAQNNLGVCYENGDGVEKDYREAVRWYRNAAAQGDAGMLCNLGRCYEAGIGVEKDYLKAAQWYRKSAEQGHAPAQLALGILYEDRKGVESNWREAARWYLLAAKCEDEWMKNIREDASTRLSALLKLMGMDEAALYGVDFSVPEGAGTRGNVFVCVVANEDYSDSGADKVPHAVNDGKVFAEYARKTLGVPERNVRVATNATRGQMRRAERWLENAVRVYPGAEVVFYYAGHGVPVVKGDRVAKKCLLPTDVPAEEAELDAVDLDELLARLSRLGAKQVTGFLDACFSGTLDKGGRGVRMKAGPTEARGNMAVFAAASGDETALPLDAERHGLFTYCLLKKLQDTKGEVTWGELGEHLKRRVPQLAHEHGLSGTQTPTVSTSGGFDLDRRLTE